METAVYWIWLQRALGVGAYQSEAILRLYGSAQEVYEAPSFPAALELAPSQHSRLADKDLSEAVTEWERLKSMGARVLTPEDELYASLFEGMYAPPVVLYAKGAHLQVSDTPVIAVVGTRRHDQAGERITRMLAAGLAASGATVVSGGAEGLDSAALDAALNENGRCISFQACGIDVEYPRAVAPLRKRLVEQGGLLLSEFPLGSPAHRHHFRIRNRLISAAADGTLVTQAPLASGALITAGWAREQGKDVFTVPGTVGMPCCEGSNELLKDGAHPVTNTADILTGYLERYPFTIDIAAAAAAEKRAAQMRLVKPSAEHRPPQVSEEPPAKQVAQPSVMPCPEGIDKTVERVYRSLCDRPRTVTELARELGMESADVLSALTELELFGVVSCEAGQRYACKLEK